MKLFFSDVKKIFTVVLGILCIFSCKMEVSGGGSESGAGSDNPESPTVVEYSIRHFVESLDGGWTELTDDRGTGQGNIASTTKYGPSDAKSYSGFSFKEVKNTGLAADGSSVVEFYYTRNTYTLTFDAGEGVFSGMGADGEDVSTLSVEFKYGQQIVPPTPTRQGYSAVWADSNTCPAENATYTVTWLEGNATLYTIRHLLESLDGEWNERIDDRSSAQGTTASTTELTESDAKSYEGFYFKEVKNTDIAADGSSEVSFYYIRNTYTLTFDAGEGTFADGKKSVTKSFKYGETVVAPTATRQGYSASWSTGDCPSENASYTVTWVPNENTSYHITHFVEMLDGSWSEKSGDRSTGRGKTDGLTTLSESDAKSYPGFTFKEVKNVKIKADGTSLVEFHYARNSYTLTFNAGEGEFDGGAKTVTRTLKYEAPVEIPTATRQGYTASWASVPGKCPSENASYTVTWIEGNATGYSIKHFVEDLNGGWTEQTGDSGTGLGKTGAMTTCSESGAKSYQGFSFKEVKNVSIAADGSSVVGFYYSRDTYTLTFNAGEGEFDGGAKTVSRTFKYEALVEIPSARRTGYSEIWTGVPNVCPAENATYTATWKASENTPYKIKHFLMNVDGRTWDERTSDESTGHGTTDAQTALTKSNAKSYTGFVFHEVKNTTIAADGSSVVEFYYRRNYYTITFVAEGGTFETGTTVNAAGNAVVNVIYGGTVTAPNVTKPGYEVSWPKFTTCTGAKTYTATWKACDVAYTVEHWRQNANDDEYTIYGSPVPMTGKTGEKTKAKVKNSTGFELREPLAQQQVEIAADGSTVVKIYYDRKVFDISFDAGDGVFLGAGENGEDVSKITKKYRYCQTVPAPPKPYKDGYVSEWSPSFSTKTKVTESVNYVAIWTAGAADTKYTVYHYQEKTDGSFEKDVTSKRESRVGVAGSKTKLGSSDAQSFIGFTFDHVENTIISADGKAIVKMYYKRNMCKIIFDAGKGSFSGGKKTIEVTGRYGTAIPEFEKPKWEYWDYTWKLGDKAATPTKFDKDGEVTYRACWTMKFLLAEAKDNNGNTVIENFSGTYKTFIQIHTEDYDAWSGIIKGKDNPVIFTFFHKDATGNGGRGDKSKYNTSCGTSEINWEKHIIRGKFYGEKKDVKLSDDYKTITLTIDCRKLYADTGAYPFGESGSYTLTFTRK